MVHGGLLSRFDDLIVLGTSSLYHGVFLPVSGLALTVVGVWLLRRALAGASRQVVITIAGLTAASAVYLTPLLYVGVIDRVAVGGVEQLRAQVLGVTGLLH